MAGATEWRTYVPLGTKRIKLKLKKLRKIYTTKRHHTMFGLFLSVPLNPVAFFPLNGQYNTADISHSSNPSGEESNVELAPGPDGSKGGSYQFWENVTSFIKFPNNGGLDTRYSMTFLVWIYHEQRKGAIFYYAGPKYYGVRFMVRENGHLVVTLRTSQLTTLKVLGGTVLQQKTWHFVGSSYDYVSGEFTLWLNGSVDSKVIVDSPAELATQESLFMGTLPGGANQFKGRISCLQVYDRVLSKVKIEDAKKLCFTTGNF